VKGGSDELHHEQTAPARPRGAFGRRSSGTAACRLSASTFSARARTARLHEQERPPPPSDGSSVTAMM